MNHDDIIRMAREAGFDPHDMSADFTCNLKDIERFAELVRADEREKSKWDVHSCGPTCTNAACVAVREAVEAEREACAKVCESMTLEWEDQPSIAQAELATMMDCALSIRARGQA